MERAVKQILTGNVFLIFCSIFYLLWWILAFKPSGAVKGMNSGWLLVPALFFGAAAVVLIIRGMQDVQVQQTMIPAGRILPFSVAAYFLLLIGTWLFLKRPVTTELVLIVAWTALTIAEINALYGVGIFSHGVSCGFMAATALSAAVSMVTYMLYYKLDAAAGYIDGMIPLILAAVMMASLSVKMIT